MPDPVKPIPASGKAPLGNVGPYRLVALVHSSPVGRLFQAQRVETGDYFALKTLLEPFHKDREKIGYLKWEHAVGTKLNHPRVIRTYEFAVDRAGPYLAMEWFPAPNLKQRIQQGISQIAHLIPKIILQATEALAYLNNQGWIHRDVKPENFLVSDKGEVKLIDFALAERRRSGLTRLLAAKAKVKGTPSYMSPEQIRGLPLDERADLYSLACTLFELCAGKPPFTGSTTKDLLTRHLRNSPPRLDGVADNITPEFAELIRLAMAKEPADRPASTQEFLLCLPAVRVFRRTPPAPQASGKSET